MPAGAADTQRKTDGAAWPKGAAVGPAQLERTHVAWHVLLRRVAEPKGERGRAPPPPARAPRR